MRRNDSPLFFSTYTYFFTTEKNVIFLDFRHKLVKFMALK
jgi:hypothetical protein